MSEQWWENTTIIATWHPDRNVALGDSHDTPVSRPTWWKGSCGHEWEASIFDRNRGKGCPFCSGRRVLVGFNDFASRHPDLVSQWDTSNADSPYEVTENSNKAVQWRCQHGHSWKAAVSTRTGGSACPYCCNRRVWTGYNDLQTLHPGVAQMWHPDNDLPADKMLPGTDKAVQWRCNHGHTWQLSVRKQVKKGVICTSCEVMSDNAEAAYPEIKSLWHPTLNQRSMTEVKSNNRSSFFWQCTQEHTWQATFSQHVRCPYCSNKEVLTGFNDLRTLSPDLVDEWHEDNVLPAQDVLADSGKKCLWKCPKGHTWKTTPRKRRRGQKCIYCQHQALLTGYNDLATTHPELVEQWSTKNPLDPTQVMAGSAQKVLWVCSSGHEWTSSINNRSHGTRGTSCPVCVGKVVLPGFNDLQTTHPHLAEEWDQSNDLLPHQVGYGSGYRPLWKCLHGHTWTAYVYNRTKGAGCPRCQAATSSAMEMSVGDWLESLEIEVVRNTKRVISPYELDIYLPQHNFAVEFNGLYWHSVAGGKDQSYHKNKVDLCNEQGIYLFQIWEDDWRDRQEIVKRMILHRLGLSEERIVYARKTHIQDISYQQASVFLDNNHIQGGTTGSNYYGLLDETGEVVAAAVFRKQQDTLYLDRYATSCRVTGGLSKIIKQARSHTSAKEIVTFADASLSQGKLYETLGFKLDGFIKPDYSYLVQGERKHKFGYRLKRFRNDPELQYVEGYSESQLAELNKLHRIWDSGKKRYVLSLV